MKISIIKGISFGLTSGIITTLGLIVGLSSSTGSASVVISGILIIAIADALSDAFGIHISEESEKNNTPQAIWEATLATFISKFIFALTFVVPVIVFSLETAISVSIAWGLSLISILSYFIAKEQHSRAWLVILEHLGITIFVIISTHFVGRWVTAL